MTLREAGCSIVGAVRVGDGCACGHVGRHPHAGGAA